MRRSDLDDVGVDALGHEELCKGWNDVVDGSDEVP